MNKKIILVGGFHEIIELCEENELNIIGIIDNISVNRYCGYPILGTDNEASIIFEKFNDALLLLSPDKPEVRKKLFNLYSNIGFDFYTLVGKKANVSKTAKIGKGCIIQNGVNISSNSEIGDFTKINTNANIMHDVRIDNFVTIAPNSVILGHVKIREMAYIGANSTILPTLIVGELSVVGAGAVVTKNVTSQNIVAGNPARNLIK